MLARPEIQWWLFLDADVMVVNPDRCIEEFIDPGLLPPIYRYVASAAVHVTFYERFWNLEMMTGGILYKNSGVAQEFLFNLAEYEFKMPSGPRLAWSG